jgi:hypothetical protein
MVPAGGESGSGGRGSVKDTGHSCFDSVLGKRAKVPFCKRYRIKIGN